MDKNGHKTKILMIVLAALIVLVIGLGLVGFWLVMPLFSSPNIVITERTTEKDGMVQVFVPAGKFQMGSMDGELDERPVHFVYLDDFWMDKTEVTNAMFRKFVNETGYQTDAEQLGYGWIWDVSDMPVYQKRSKADWAHPEGYFSNIDGKDQWPVILVTWNDANSYCNWAGKRLPTEAEWEKAARGVDGRKYPWGNKKPACDLANSNQPHANICLPGPAPAGSYPQGASPYGALDMAGNVYEWVSDWYAADYYSASPEQNPTGPVDGMYKSVRGGDWFHDVQTIRTSSRDHADLGEPGQFTGFRCASSQP